MKDTNLFFSGDIFVSDTTPPLLPSTAWIEESFSFETPTAKQIVVSDSTTYLGSNFSARRRWWLMSFIAISLCILLVKIISLQFLRGTNYRAMAEGHSQRLIPISAERGLIYDRLGIQLVQNVPNFSLAITPQYLPKNSAQREIIVHRLAQLTRRTDEDIAETLRQYGNYSFESVIIEENLDYDTALSIQIEAADLSGVRIERGSKRFYQVVGNDLRPSSTTPISLSHIIGYEGKLNPDELKILYGEGYIPSDSIGKIGLEKTYEKYLRGTYGKQRIEVNALGKEQSVLEETPPVPGSHIELTIDIGIQRALEDSLFGVLKEKGKARGSAIALNPNTGEILGLVSLPAFDNNDFSSGIKQAVYTAYLQDVNQPFFNRAISGVYPSGSSIKPAIAAIALESGIITAKTTVVSTGGVQVGPWFFPDWLAGGHGVVDVRKSLAWSVNTFYYYIGGGYGNFVGLGIEKMVTYLRTFGFSTQLGIDLPGEASGFLPTKEWKEQTKKERWFVGDTYNVSIGQGDVLVTPLQIADMTASIANGGTLYRPHLLLSSIDPLTKKKQSVLPEIIRAQVVSPKNVETVRLGMRDCVLYGSCQALRSLPFSVAGKTGTAQWKQGKDTHAWFTSFAPFEHPQIVVIALIEEGGEGSGSAVPVVKKFYEWWGKERYRQ